MKHGQITIGVLTGVIILISSIAAPILYITGINQTFAVQQVQQDAKIENNVQSISDLKAGQDLLGKKVDKLLWKAGIDPTSITTQINDSSRSRMNLSTTTKTQATNDK